MKKEVLNRFYKISINIGPIRIYNNSKVYEIRKGRSTILPGIPFSILIFFFGWWSFSIRKPFSGIRKSLEALHINFSGGEDITKLINEDEFDDKTNFIYNNLLLNTRNKLNLEDVEIIIEIQDEYNKLGNSIYSEENVQYIIRNLSKINIKNISKEQIKDIFDAMKIIEKY